MSETSSFDDEVRKQLARQHDDVLSALMLNRKERRRRGVRATRKDLERFLFATGAAIAQSQQS